MGEEFTIDQVAKHTTLGDLWIVIKDNVYDVSSFLDEHPGGREYLIKAAGRDATDWFLLNHDPDEILPVYGPRFLKGTLKK